MSEEAVGAMLGRALVWLAVAGFFYWSLRKGVARADVRAGWPPRAGWDWRPAAWTLAIILLLGGLASLGGTASLNGRWVARRTGGGQDGRVMMELTLHEEDGQVRGVGGLTDRPLPLTISGYRDERAVGLKLQPPSGDYATFQGRIGEGRRVTGTLYTRNGTSRITLERSR